ncbi:DUF2917 domain-containing protein [Polaromonas sp. SM01]|uniref:DUF2917 domain-containing protein n=1 Tax=Polaromonas sp. SM01 TaxID=3085630 RepID=UPI002981B04D|nr:DUF2917 domain-containing protein [Polaromonas sp. SM01]MDW5441791.1 DUF2917 domain-containing protein [Polaromonas sp. SM01]
MNPALNPLHALPANPFAAWLRAARLVAVHRPMVVSGASRDVHELVKGSTVTVLQPQGTVMECLEGCVWITFDKDIRDTVLEAGEHFCADRNSRALIHAFEASRVRVAQAAPACSKGS